MGLCTGTGLGCPWARPTLNTSGAAYRWTGSLGGSWLKILILRLISGVEHAGAGHWCPPEAQTPGEQTSRAEDLKISRHIGTILVRSSTSTSLSQGGSNQVRTFTAITLSAIFGIVEISNIKIFYSNRPITLIFILFIDHSIVEEFMFINKISVENLRIYSY